ncbi:NAD-binding Rossmann fold oxidoreductase family protein [Myriangium duriaei CBS 260.36]|uniref:NAD-binding Rossmann fold oxidoreductase family protein n=1 Tax=Myriangium duriaei CBS 260.36 TaxID=1168546 RepID=A0A9P4J2H7_9PEZI|nr:NAD-binding Rossmann fold oxidoreductase family protein [Myriangium duriaei CBS 260.36]
MTATAPPRKLRIAISGLGRMGKRHALTYVGRASRADVVAAFTPEASEAAWASSNLPGVKIYSDYDAMLAHPGLEAVVISTATSVHAEQAIKSINKGLHTMCEKPLSIHIDEAQKVVDAAATRPKSQKILCGFSRRFDASYRDAAQRIDSGSIGRPSVFRSQTCDKLDPSGFFVAYAEFSGGIFVDCSIHDIDLALWFFGPESRVKSVSAVGVCAAQPALRQHQDVDNAVGVVEFWEDRIAYFYASRTMAAGQHDMSEIVGTEGKLIVNGNPQTNLLEISDKTGYRREVPPDYYGRFGEAFATEANEFTAACLDDTPLPFKLTGAVRALQIGAALQESLRSGKKIHFDEVGHRVEKATL